jgi:hypothetical protein
MTTNHTSGILVPLVNAECVVVSITVIQVVSVTLVPTVTANIVLPMTNSICYNKKASNYVNRYPKSF